MLVVKILSPILTPLFSSLRYFSISPLLFFLNHACARPVEVSETQLFHHSNRETSSYNEEGTVQTACSLRHIGPQSGFFINPHVKRSLLFLLHHVYGGCVVATMQKLRLTDNPQVCLALVRRLAAPLIYRGRNKLQRFKDRDGKKEERKSVRLASMQGDDVSSHCVLFKVEKKGNLKNLRCQIFSNILPQNLSVPTLHHSPCSYSYWASTYSRNSLRTLLWCQFWHLLVLNNFSEVHIVKFIL